MTNLRIDPLLLTFGHLTSDNLFDGACFIEPPAYDRPGRLSFMMGQCAFIQSRSYREAHEAAEPGFAVDACKGYILERADLQSAVEAYTDSSWL